MYDDNPHFTPSILTFGKPENLNDPANSSTGADSDLTHWS